MASVKTYSDPLEMLEAMEAEGIDTWEAAVSAGKADGKTDDEKKWELGDLACHIETKYGENSIAKYAKAIGRSVDALKGYRTLCRFWDRKTTRRNELIAELQNLSMSHFKYAASFGDHGLATMFLEACNALELTCEAARVQRNKLLGLPVPPQKIADATGKIARTYTQEEGLFVVIQLEPGLDLDTLIENKQKARRFVIYAGGDE